MSDEKKSDLLPDKDLDNLLKSALEDFDKPLASTSDSQTVSSSNSNPKPDEWNDEFIQAQAKLFEEKMAELFGGTKEDAPSSDDIALRFQKMAEAAAMAINPETESQADPQFTQSITEALKGLSAGQENIKNPINPDDIAKMFGGLDMNDGNSTNQFLPFMQGMLESILSAEVLLPSLKEMSEKYPKWLEENKNKLSSEDLEKYTKQHQLMQTICAELETEKADDPADVKKKRFQKVLENMQKMQDLGQPPDEFLSDIGPGPGLPPIDSSALNDPSQCTMM